MHFTINNNTIIICLHKENQLSWELYTVSNVFSWFWGEIWPADVPDQLSHTHTHTSIHTHNSSRFASVQQISAWFWSFCGLISSFLQCHAHFFSQHAVWVSWHCHPVTITCSPAWLIHEDDQWLKPFIQNSPAAFF